MFTNLSFITSGEFSPSYGIVKYLSGNALNLSSYEAIDELKVATIKFKLQYLMDYVHVTDIIFDYLPSEQRNMISQLYYGDKIYGVINMESATAKKRMDSNAVRFEDPSEGYVAILHAMLRKGLSEVTPIETVLGRIHGIATKFMYTTIIRSFDKYFNLMDKPEKDLAKIRYACAYVLACKMFTIDCSPNDIAIPTTSMVYSRVNPSDYETTEDLSTYKGMVNYLSETKVLEGLNIGAFMEAFIRHLGNRSLAILECGADFTIDVLLSKSIGRLIPRNLFKLVGPKECEVVSRLIAATFHGKADNAGDIPAMYKYTPPTPKKEPKEEPAPTPVTQPATTPVSQPVTTTPQVPTVQPEPQQPVVEPEEPNDGYQTPEPIERPKF